MQTNPTTHLVRIAGAALASLLALTTGCGTDPSTLGSRSTPADHDEPALAQGVARELQLELGQARVGRFSDGEVTFEIDENVRGEDVFLLQSTCAPTNDNLMELMIMADAMRRSSAQRITAVVMAVYIAGFAVLLVACPPEHYGDWRALFQNQLMRVATFVFFISLFWHAWIGVRDIFMDYIKPTALRLALEVATVLVLVAYAGWAVQILWSL